MCASAGLGISRELWPTGRVLLLPWPLGAVRGDEYPCSSKGIEAAVRDIIKDSFFRHGFGSLRMRGAGCGVGMYKNKSGPNDRTTEPNNPCG